MCYHTHNHAGVAWTNNAINFHLTSKESRTQSNLFSNSISAALGTVSTHLRLIDLKRHIDILAGCKKTGQTVI
jgi:hypothetical protein